MVFSTDGIIQGKVGIPVIAIFYGYYYEGIIIYIGGTYEGTTGFFGVTGFTANDKVVC